MSNSEQIVLGEPLGERMGKSASRKEHLLDTNEVARILGVHVQTVRRYIRAKQLPAIQLTPRLYKVRQGDLDQFLNTRRTVPSSGSQS